MRALIAVVCLLLAVQSDIWILKQTPLRSRIADVVLITIACFFLTRGQ